ncbi:helix-turn-helix transcriptional regulator [Sporomusa sphaeroides DSM 2875]|uniref:helix-turn-helix transcriptional regulator n=1 Tax=Sporomusa sphaeroides TaxID=47679 RepID=UPI00202EDE65|nr:helix-turn-helix transcriptional regulator [Sporomusa sphaeroides]MCM0757380.1 helix-turn-helix transcriptional regulator [Sporomusa sphaeroides DSM 2875]
MDIIDRLKYLRSHYKLTQAEFAKAIGLSQGNVSDMERRKFHPSIDTVISVCRYFSISADWILLGIGNGPGESIDHQSATQKVEAVFDPDLKKMIDILQNFMLSGDPDLRGWTKVQFMRAFGEQSAAVEEKKQHA